MFRDDFEKLAHDIACVVMYGKVGGEVRQPVIEKVAAMLRKGPGFTLWPLDHAEACQRAREAALKRPVMPSMPKPTPPQGRVVTEAGKVIFPSKPAPPVFVFPSKKP